MTPQAREPQAYLDALIGQHCLEVTNSAGSVLLIDFANETKQASSLEPSSPRSTLLVDSPWRVQTEQEVLCDCNAENSPSGELQTCVVRLVGQKVRTVQVSLPAYDFVLTFDDGIRLVVFSDADVNREHAWTFFGGEGGTLIAGHCVGRVGWRVEPGIEQEDDV